MDKDGSGFIDTHSLTTLLQYVDPPMGVKGLKHVAKRVQEIVMATDIPIRCEEGGDQVGVRVFGVDTHFCDSFGPVKTAVG